MAYVKILWRKDANALIRYCADGLEQSDAVDSEGCPPEEEGAKQSLEAIRSLHNYDEGYQAAHVIQSWSPEESKKLTQKEVNQMGMELATKYFEGHQFLVYTHSHDGHLHNHIVVSTFNADTGKRITNKKRHLYKLREHNDQICRAHGLSVIENQAHNRNNKLPEIAKRIENYRGSSYLFDMKQKADFARSYSTNYAEYAGILKEFGIQVRIKEKDITYYYPGKEKGKRGDKLGDVYHKSGLEEAFKKNDTQFAARPELKATLHADLSTFKTQGRHDFHPTSEVLQKSGSFQNLKDKNYGAFQKTSRKAGADRAHPGDADLAQSIIPIQEIRKARTANIPKYCEKHKIPLLVNEKGETVLKDRNHIVVADHNWTNRKNQTKGTLIEFVASHHNMTFLQAIAHINDNPRLLLLEKHFGEQKRNYTSFHIPKPETMDFKKSLGQVESFLKAFGTNSKIAPKLLSSGQVQVHKDGLIRLFPKDRSDGAFEYSQGPNQQWTKVKRGEVHSPFYSSRGTGSSATIFTDPFSFMKKRGADLFSNYKRNEGILVLMEPNSHAVDLFVGSNNHIKKLQFVAPEKHVHTQAEIDFFNNLKARYSKLGIGLEFTSFEKALSKKGPELSI